MTSLYVRQTTCFLCLAVALYATPVLAQTPPPPLPAGDATTSAPEPISGKASPEALAALKRLEIAHGKMKTLSAEFHQKKQWGGIGEPVESNGELHIQMPNKVRCEFEKPDPTILLFAGDRFFHYTRFSRKEEQVDAYRFSSPEEAQQNLRMRLLGFGVSSEEILQEYDVELLVGTGADKDQLIALAFTPIRKNIKEAIKKISVWFNAETLHPKFIREEHVSEDTVDINITKLEIDKVIDEKTFRPDWPEDIIIWH